jgi:hypothetical protein
VTATIRAFDKRMRSIDRAWNFNGSETNETVLRPLSEQVESQFVLPPKRLCRYFAASHDEYLQQMNGEHYRGFHVPRFSRFSLPPYLLHSFFRPFEEITSDVPFEETVAFDNLIYVRDTTCRDVEVGFVTTYAHELQHFVQHGYTPKLSAVNSVLYQNLKRFKPDAIAIDIPHEREANIVSKRVAETVCGVAAVREYAEQQILYMEQVGDAEQKARWIFFRDIPSSTVCDLLQETLPFLEEYRRSMDFKFETEQLIAEQQRSR